MREGPGKSSLSRCLPVLVVLSCCRFRTGQGERLWKAMEDQRRIQIVLKGSRGCEERESRNDYKVPRSLEHALALVTRIREEVHSCLDGDGKFFLLKSAPDRRGPLRRALGNSSGFRLPKAAPACPRPNI